MDIFLVWLDIFLVSPVQIFENQLVTRPLIDLILKLNKRNRASYFFSLSFSLIKYEYCSNRLPTIASHTRGGMVYIHDLFVLQ